VASLDEVRAEHEGMLGRMVLMAPKLAHEQGANNGFRVSFNTGADGGQEIYHLHMHIMGGPRPWSRG
jgi:histidine triad (HIT) family protein